ncbi:MAG: 30S ribosomal protein S9 [Bacteroidota bacterium]
MYIMQATGRRKTATASARLAEGKGEIWVNKRPIEKYFSTSQLIQSVKKPLYLTEEITVYDIHLSVKGGGTTGQAEAACLAIARAIVKLKPGHHPIIKKNGLLTRDARKVERKKPGQKKARKKFTWVKR